MLKRKPHRLWLVAIILLAFAFKPGDPLKERVQKALEEYLQYFPQEKIYLQLDKGYYASGSTIWYKAYVTKDYLPTNLSTILYVELIDKKGKVLQQDKLPIKDGGAWGNFSLPPELAPGDYRIRAFTWWMMNFDPAYLYNRDIHVFPAGKDEGQAEDTAVEPDFAVQFFPEGGDLIDSVQSVVAFKAIGTNGYPIAVSGKIKDDGGHEIAAIRSVHDGMGQFTFRPLPGHTYQAEVTTEDGKAKTFSLPAAKAAGAVLHIISAGDGRMFFQVLKNDRTGEMFDKLALVGQLGGHLTYFVDIDFSQGLIGGLIPTKDVPTGIMQLTLFTTEGVPLAERLIFVKNDSSRLPLTLTTDSISLGPRGKNKFTVAIPETANGHFSVSVTDADQVEELPGEDNIISHLLLNADLRGNVYNPGWYFEKDDSLTREALDLVMLTNGWRRFVWQKFLNNQFPDMKYPAEVRGLQVRGQAFDRKGPLKNGSISMFIKAPYDSLTYFISGNTEANGYFEVNDLNFHDTADLYYKATDTLHKGRDVTLKFNENPTAEPYIRLNNPIRAFLPPPKPSLQHYLELAQERNQLDKYISGRTVLLKEVNITATRIPKKEKTEDKYVTGMFKSDNGYTFDLTDENLPYTSIFQYLQGRVPGLLITGNPSDPSVRWRGGTPGFFLDEVPTGAGDIGMVPVQDIALIKVYRPPFVGGFGGQDGAIAIYTKRGGGSFNPGKGFERKRVGGYSVERQFYSPDYSVDKKINELPDKRATVYWNPNLIADSATRQLSFSFYNTDVTKRFNIVIEGIADDGRIGRIKKTIE